MQEHTYSREYGGQTFTWSIPLLWADSEKFPIIGWEIPSSLLNEWYWSAEDTLADHALRVISADLSYPILTHKGHIIDGVHRCLKALALGHTHIPSRDFSDLPPPHLVSVSEVGGEPSAFTYGDMLALVVSILGGQVSLLEVVEV